MTLKRHGSSHRLHIRWIEWYCMLAVLRWLFVCSKRVVDIYNLCWYTELNKHTLSFIALKMIFSIDPIVDDINRDIREIVNSIRRRPKLQIVKTSDDFASTKYVNNKVNAGNALGFDVSVIDPTQIGVGDPDGIIVQLPVGEQYDKDQLLSIIDQSNDVDGFSISACGELMQRGDTTLAPCTARAIVQIVDRFFNHDIRSKNIVIINRSNIVGKPAAMMLLHRDATVTICHSKTDDITKYTKNADCVITAVGKPNFITRDMLKSGALVIDVSINRSVDNKVCGDCDRSLWDSSEVYCTPVPKGVGRLTVANLLLNTAIAAKIHDCGEKCRVTI